MFLFVLSLTISVVEKDLFSMVIVISKIIFFQIILNFFTYRFIEELYRQGNSLPSNELNKDLCRVGSSSKLRLSFYQEFIIKMLSVYWDFALSEVNKC